MEKVKDKIICLFLSVVCICVFVYIKLLLCVNIGLTGKIEENISIKIIQIYMHYDRIWLHLLKDLNLNCYDNIWNLFRLPGMTCCSCSPTGRWK